MKKLFISIGILTSSVLIACNSVSTPPPPRVESTLLRTATGPLVQQKIDLVEVTATVKKINYRTREVVLLKNDQQEIHLRVDESMERLNEVRVGDQVQVGYYESLAFAVRPISPEEYENPTVAEIAAGKTDLNLPPGVELSRVTHTVLKIVSINLVNSTVTVQNPDGLVQTIKVMIPENLSRIKVGDTVAVSYAQAVALTVQPVSR